MTHRIMLVEDNPADIALVRLALEEAEVSAEFDEHHDGESAILAIGRLGVEPAERRPHLILLDLNLPRVHGREVLEAVRADARLAAIPVVVFSSSERSMDRSHCLALGITDYLVKPRSMQEMLALGRRIAQILLSSATGSQTDASRP